MRKELLKKLIIVSFVISIQVAGLYLYFANEDFISQISVPKLKEIYLPSYLYKADTLKTDIIITAYTALGINDTPGATTKNTADSVPVLLYHGIVEKPDGSNILLKDFRDQMFTLKDAGYHAVTLEQFHDYVKYGKELPQKSFLITFDDGRKDSYYPVDPILEALDYHAVIFIITRYGLEEKSNYYLEEKELKKMIKTKRWSIQSHSYDGHGHHVISPDGTPGYFFGSKLWLDDEQRIETPEEYNTRIIIDLLRSKNDIKTTLGTDVLGFAFPFGDIGKRYEEFSGSDLFRAVNDIYPLAFIQYSPGRGFAHNIPLKDSFIIRRINVKPEMSASTLLKVLETGKAKKLPYTDDFDTYDGWIKGWGRLTFRDGLMVIGENRASDNLVFLDGTPLWENYTYTAKVRSPDTETVSLVARYNDAKNYIACVYSKSYIRIEQRLDNNRTLLAEEKKKQNTSVNDMHIGIRVNGSHVECLMDSISIINSSMIDPVLYCGGIGLKSHSPLIDGSGIEVKEILVDEISVHP